MATFCVRPCSVHSIIGFPMPFYQRTHISAFFCNAHKWTKKKRCCFFFCSNDDTRSKAIYFIDKLQNCVEKSICTRFLLALPHIESWNTTEHHIHTCTYLCGTDVVQVFSVKWNWIVRVRLSAIVCVWRSPCVYARLMAPNTIYQNRNTHTVSVLLTVAQRKKNRFCFTPK